MKKLFAFLSAFVVFFSQIGVSGIAFAQLASPAPIPSIINPLTNQPIDIPGKDCGNGDAVDAQFRKCCVSVHIVPNSIFLDVVKQARGLPGIGRFIDPLVNFWDLMTQFEKSVNVVPCVIGAPSNASNPASCTCIPTNQITPSPIQSLINMCAKYMGGSSERGACESCAQGGGVYTGVVCAKTDFGVFIQDTVFSFGIGLAGIMALLCIIYAAFIMQTSSGNPEKIKKAQEMLTSCIMGLVLIIFSVFILRLIGVNILKIPGFK